MKKLLFGVLFIPVISLAQLQLNLEQGRLKEGPELIVLGKGILPIFTMIKNQRTGKEIEFKSGDAWKIVDTIYNQKDDVKKAVIESRKGERIEINLTDYSFVSEYFMTKSDADNIIRKYGKSSWKNIMAGTVIIGWTKKLCELSWGTPNDIHKSIGGYGIHEQWVYTSGYLYFENGKLTTIQN